MKPADSGFVCVAAIKKYEQTGLELFYRYIHDFNRYQEKNTLHQPVAVFIPKLLLQRFLDIPLGSHIVVTITNAWIFQLAESQNDLTKNSFIMKFEPWKFLTIWATNIIYHHYFPWDCLRSLFWRHSYLTFLVSALMHCVATGEWTISTSSTILNRSVKNTLHGNDFWIYIYP